MVSADWCKETPHTNSDSIPIAIFRLFFTEMTQLLVAETNKYYKYNWHLDIFYTDDKQSWLPDINVQEMHVFLAFMINVTWCQGQSEEF
jgi:hypothetical protein